MSGLPHLLLLHKDVFAWPYLPIIHEHLPLWRLMHGRCHHSSDVPSFTPPDRYCVLPQGALCGKGIIRLCHFMRVVAVTISSANSHPRNYSTETSVVVTVEINELLFCRPCSGRNAQTGQPAACPKWSGRRSLWRKARHTVRPVVPRQAVRALQSR